MLDHKGLKRQAKRERGRDVECDSIVPFELPAAEEASFISTHSRYNNYFK